MADVSIKVIDPADSYALLTIDELKAVFLISPSNTTFDAQLQMLIDQYSDVIATICDRTFAKEKVEETWCGDPPPYENYRIFLSHYPVADGDVESVYAPGGTLIDPAGYAIEGKSGKLTLLGTWTEPIIVTYTGGYDLPEDTPPALKAAAELMIQAAAGQLARGLNTGVRSISHKDSRVMYFDPNAANKNAHMQPVAGSAAVQSLLQAYMRFQV